MQFPLPVSDGYLQELKAMVGDIDSKEEDHGGPMDTESMAPVETPDADAALSTNRPSKSQSLRHHPELLASSGIVPPAPTKWSPDEAIAQADLPDVPFRFSEKRRLHWSDKTCK